MTNYLDDNLLKIRYYKCYYDRIDISEGIDPTKSKRSKECIICHYWFFNHGFKFQDSVCNDCHNLPMLNLNIRNIVIITVRNIDYRCTINSNSKSEEINLLQSSMLGDCEYI